MVLISPPKISHSKITYLLILFLFIHSNGDINSQFIYAHFFGITKNAGDYQIVFAPSPSLPIAGYNSTLLNFSILDRDNRNIDNIFVSLIIKNKMNDSIIQSFPFKFYEFSDITLPYTFKEIGDYEIYLLIKISWDTKYSEVPISVNFDISTANPNQVIPTVELIIYYVVPTLVVIGIIVVYLRHKNKI